MAFRVDVLFNSLNDFQGEKANLEHQLNDIRYKRRGLETILDQCKSKANQIHETNQAMQEASKVAQHKVAQMQMLAKSLEDANEKSRAKLKDLTTRTEDNHKCRQEDVLWFEQELEKLANNMKIAKENYAEILVTAETENTVGTKEEVNQAVNLSQDEVQSLVDELEKLAMEDKKMSGPIISANMQNIVLNMVLKEKEAVNEATPTVKQDLEYLREELYNLEQALQNSGKDIMEDVDIELVAAET